jgi:nicotinamide mononucleotide transporter
LQGIFFIQGIAGIIVWYHNRETNEKNKYIKTKVEKLSNKGRLVYITPVLILYLIVSCFLSKYTNSAIPYIDSLVATLSLFANYLLVRRKIESWWIWILVDVIYVGLFISQGLYVSLALYLVLLIISNKGFINWNITLKSYL